MKKNAKKFFRKIFTPKFLKKFVWGTARFILLFELAFIILFPFIIKISAAFMSRSDIVDRTVKYLPKNPTFENINFVIEQIKYFPTAFNTAMISLIAAICSIVVACLVGYGLAKFNFRGRSFVLVLAVLSLLIPPQTVLVSMFTEFRYFDLFGIFNAIRGQPLNLIDTLWPLALLSMTGFGFRGGLYIFIMRQFFKGIPDELAEAAYVDGCGTFKTFISIIIPLSTPMLVTVGLFAFAWQWTDTFYSGIFFSGYNVLANQVFTVSFIPDAGVMFGTTLSSIMTNTAVLLAIIPLIIFYIFAQKKLVQGVERSGLVG